MADVSAVIATLNEEDQIRGCLETLSWCDEIIVVDNDSSDNTVQIAQEYTSRIYDYKERHGYGDPLKKYGIKQASNEWVLVLDADELVPVTLAQRLQYTAHEESADVVKVPFKNHSLGIWVRGGGWWPAYHPRFFRRDAVEITEDIHGYINIKSGAEVVELPAQERNCVVHFNHLDVEDKLARVNSYTTVEAKKANFSIRQVLISPGLEFFNRLILKRGYRLGWHGLLLAIFQAWYKWLVAVKRWEIDRTGGREGIKEHYDQIRQEVLNEWENE